jgi:hypothetical protein
MNPLGPPRTHGKQDSTWTISTDAMKRSWAISNKSIQQGQSEVTGVVGISLLEDCNSLVSPESMCLPACHGDERRAEECFFWLAKWVIPIWLSWGLKKHTQHKAELLGALVQDLEYAPKTITAVGQIVQKLYLRLSEEGLHRRSLHYAQGMGMRAAYRGAILHPNPQVHMLSLMAAHIAVVTVPNMEEETVMITESTKASVLLLFDELLQESE